MKSNEEPRDWAPRVAVPGSSRRRFPMESIICVATFFPVALLTFAVISSFDGVLAHVVSVILCFLWLLIQQQVFSPKLSEVSTRSSLLGHVAGLGFFTVLFYRNIWMFGAYLILLSHFHWSEYLFVSLFCPHSCSKKSFILNHSPAYLIATVASWTEFLVIQFFFPGFRSCSVISWVGLILCVLGELMRKLAIFTAGENFNHVVEDQKREEHRLVTTGVYSFCRHPSYFGWWMYAVGTQLVLQNPVCTVGFFYGAWRFFSDRVPFEEELLVEFFGEKYIKYQQQVPLRLPFIPDPAKLF